MYFQNDKQLNYNDGWFLKSELDKEHFIFKLAEAINWNNITTKLAKFYCCDNDRSTKPARVKVRLLLLQRIYNTSDKDTINAS